ncbi:hypothetical protein DCAR_0832103 [Daucus carota subsp. sativus]|uniref:Reverse transcriptase Ty1/copia-type domain-containing protein n=1 Tax=Daucus carota subsp. sativus TaxID=79200 RepID=A0AAF0XSP4_DAUCS|nr:hypothetical protein DCAR_0832103 [Daucus carota subsp. sativus]
MSGDKSQFLSLKMKKGGRVTIGDSKTLPILGKGTIGNSIISINKEPKNVQEALQDENWIMAMQEELNQFERCDVWELVDPPEDASIVGTKWVFKNKVDEFGTITRNKARLVAQGYNQQEGIDFDQTYAPVASGTITLGLFYPITNAFDLVGYSDADYAGSQTDRKSTSGVCAFLGQSLVSWLSKKQTSVALSTAEGEYLAAGSCCSQMLWMRQQLKDFGIKCKQTPIFCDNTSTINISENPVNHSRTKHIDVRHHFLRDNVAKGNWVCVMCSQQALKHGPGTLSLLLAFYIIFVYFACRNITSFNFIPKTTPLIIVKRVLTYGFEQRLWHS